MHIHTESSRGCLVSSSICLVTLRWVLSHWLEIPSQLGWLASKLPQLSISSYVCHPKLELQMHSTIPSFYVSENQSIRAQVQTHRIHRKTVWHGCSGLSCWHCMWRQIQAWVLMLAEQKRSWPLSPPQSLQKCFPRHCACAKLCAGIWKEEDNSSAESSHTEAHSKGVWFDMCSSHMGGRWGRGTWARGAKA